MESLIKMKSENSIELTDRELAVRWWNRLSVEEKQSFLNTYLPSSFKIGNMDYETIYWVWLKKQKL